MHAAWLALSAVLGNLVKGKIGFWIMSALAAFGLHLVTSNFVMEPVLAEIQTHMTGMPGNAVAWFRYLEITKVITMTLSAYAAASAFSAIRLAKAVTPA